MNVLLPHFIIIGAMKSGTTTLYRNLDLHPEINMSRDKETDFFVAGKNWELGVDWYSKQFSSPQKIRGEASPNYTKARYFQGVPARMASLCPDVKLIYIVRDPLERAVSQYKHSYILGMLDEDFEKFEGSHEYNHILDASSYARQISEYLNFFDRNAILIIDFDDLIVNPQRVMNQIYSHIGVSEYKVKDRGAQNDSNELSRIPSPVLRFAQSPIGKRIAGNVPRGLRDRLRSNLAVGAPRVVPDFPISLLKSMASDLTQETNEFRKLVDMEFPGWSI